MFSRTPRRYEQGSDFELAYASEATFIRKRGSKEFGTDRMERHRRFRGSSDDKAGNRRDNQMIHEDHRLGGPNLCPFPVETIEFPIGDRYHHLSQLAKEIMPRVMKVLQNYSYQPAQMRFVKRHPINSTRPKSEAIMTFLVYFKPRDRPQESKGLNCIMEISRILRQEKITDCSIEFTESFPGVQLPITYPVRRSDAIHGQWRSVLREILQSIQESRHRKTNDCHRYRQYIQAIGCFRRGRIEDRDKEDSEKATPTVLIMVHDTRSSKDWRPMRDAVVRILDARKLCNVAVEIIQDRVRRTPVDTIEDGVSPELLDGKIAHGHSINNPSAHATGTLGGFLKIPVKHGQEQRREYFALTCFHCICDGFPQKQDRSYDVFLDWRKRGIKPEDSRRDDPTEGKFWNVEHPSSEALRIQINFFDSKIREIEENPTWKADRTSTSRDDPSNVLVRLAENLKNYKQYRLKAIALHKKGTYLGNIYAGFRGEKFLSRYRDYGLRTDMDWALIQLDKSRYRAALNHYKTDKFLGSAASEDVLNHLDASEVLKDGWATERTVGTYTSLEMVIRRDAGRCESHEMFNIEHVVVGKGGKPFADRGDSGALIFTGPEHRVIGMLRAGFVTTEVSIFTRIDDLFDDIKKAVGVTDVAMAECGPSGASHSW